MGPHWNTIARRLWLQARNNLVRRTGVWGGLMLLAAVFASASLAGGTESRATNAAPAGVTSAAAMVSAHTGRAVWKAPGPAFNAAKAKGKTIMYLPNDFTIPILQTIAAELKTALSKAGVKLVICDGKGEPTQFKTCADSAVAQHMSAIIVESLPPSLIGPSLADAQKAHIAVIAGNDADPSDPLPLSSINARVAFPYIEAGVLTADTVIADSNGAAHVLILGTSDSSNAPDVETKGMVGTFKKLCPGCKLTVKDTPVSTWATDLGPLTQSALRADPSINYVMPVYDPEATFVLPAIQQAGDANRVKVASFNGTLNPLQALARKNIIFADVGSDNAFEGWAYADQVLRLLSGVSPAKNENVPLRVFTSANIHTLTLTNAAENSGSWYGSTSYQAQYLHLWGVQK